MTLTPLILLGASYATSDVMAAELSRALGRPVYAHGVRGASLAEWSHAREWSDLPADADVLVLELGGNGPVGEDLVRETHRALSRHFDSVTWAIPPRWAQTGEIAERRRMAAHAIIAADVPRVDSRWHAVGHVAGDGVHLTATGYRAYARALGHSMTRHTRVLRVLRYTGIAAAAAAAVGLVVLGGHSA